MKISKPSERKNLAQHAEEINICSLGRVPDFCKSCNSAKESKAFRP